MLSTQVSSGSIKNKGTNKIEKIKEGWQRNPSWLPITSPGPSENKIVILHPVYPRPTYLAFNMQMASTGGSYSVNWGDGTSNTYNSAITANKVFDSSVYNNPLLDGTDAPVTITSASNTVFRNNHGYSNNQEIIFYNVTGSSNILEEQVYFTCNVTTNSFQVTEEKYGSPITLGADGTATLLPYKQVIITITAVSSTFLEPNFAAHWSASLYRWQQAIDGVGNYWVSNSLEMHISAPNTSTIRFYSPGFTSTAYTWLEHIKICSAMNCTGSSASVVAVTNLAKFTSFPGAIFNTWTPFSFGALRSLREVENLDLTGVSGNFMPSFSNCESLRKITLNAPSTTTLANLFVNCFSLKEVSITTSATLTDVSSAFSTCYSLEKVSISNTAGVTNANLMFSSCRSLKEVPIFNLPALTTCVQMFQNCFNIESAPYFNAGNSWTNASGMFQGCASLQYANVVNTSSVTNASSMFKACYNLKRLSKMSFNAVTQTNEMFNSSFALREVELTNANLLSTANNMFGFAYSFAYPPLIESSALTNLADIFSNTLVVSAPNYNTANVTTVNNMFAGNNMIINEIPAYNLDKCTTIASGFAMRGLQRFKPYNIRTSFSLNTTGSLLQTSELQNILDVNIASPIKVGTNVSGVAAPTATLSGNPGTPTVVTLTGTTTSGSSTVTMANTSGLSVGMEISGTNISTAVAVTQEDSGNTITRNNHGLPNGTQVSFTQITTTVSFQDTGDTVTLVNHGMQNGDIVRFTTITTTTGISINTNYFVRNATADTFQLSTSSTGGSIIALTNNGTGVMIFAPRAGTQLYTIYYVINTSTNTFQISSTENGSALDIPYNCSANMLYRTTITAITPNTNITLGVPASGSGSVSTTSSVFKRSSATLKGFSLTI
jgi:hypothetical protein